MTIKHGRHSASICPLLDIHQRQMSQPLCSPLSHTISMFTLAGLHAPLFTWILFSLSSAWGWAHNLIISRKLTRYRFSPSQTVNSFGNSFLTLESASQRKIHSVKLLCTSHSAFRLMMIHVSQSVNLGLSLNCCSVRWLRWLCYRHSQVTSSVRPY